MTTPIGYIDYNEYTYRTFFYSITYINMDVYNEPGEYVGVEIKILGFNIYRNIGRPESMSGE